MKNLKKLREEKGESQYDVANALDISQSAIQQYEQGKRGRHILEVLGQLADYYHVSVDYLMGRTTVRDTLTDKDKELGYRINNLRTPKMRDAALEMLDEIERLISESSKD